MEDHEAERILRGIKDFRHYLQKMEKDLDHVRKRLSHKEIRESARFVENGIQEALNYLAIVKKVIEKTQRVLSKKALD